MHSRKMIFIRCRKTASTSLEIELSKHAERGDVVTAVSPRDEQLRAEHGGKIPDADAHPFYNHASAAEIRKFVSPEIWDSYFKFCIDRNPWDKVVSMFYHRRARPTAARNFSDFISSGEFKDARNFPLYGIASSVIVDHVGRYENLDEELEKIFSRIGLSYSGLSCRAKSQFRERKDYRDLYDATSIKAVANAFAEEISLHAYQF
ncbi:sulfotransferase family protein [Variovorax sp. ZS18.2.2]|uniref:sulfotransferase family protein n=1 Tax=Variovorax sp. ZS18.2.2 TaxID=2971255 RepID=UPI00215108A8|nr:sulfotransferase family protein [Variovorax sp. ZS18.2.2]MCR6476513.1 sulfotransferase family protein [Variovorax sp. ZS18.2.2]